LILFKIGCFLGMTWEILRFRATGSALYERGAFCMGVEGGCVIVMLLIVVVPLLEHFACQVLKGAALLSYY
jgi:hypothetical protein